MFIRKSIGIVAVIAAVCFLASCAGSPPKVEPVVSLGDPMEQVSRLDKDIGTARNNQLNVLAPTTFARAEAFLNESKKVLDSGDNPSIILQKITKGRVQLKLAEEMSKRARTVLPDLIKARDLARAAGATNFGADYAEVEKQFLELTKAVESDKLSRARKNQPKVAECFRQLELRAIKDQTLGEARKLIKQAEKEGAQKTATKMYAVATKKLAEVDAFITEHPYQKVKMHTMASDALFQAGRVLQVTRQSQTIRTMQPEDITLWVEEMLHKTANRLSAPDMRNKSIDTQVENILGSITALQEDRRFMMDKVKTRQAEIEAMKKQIASLEGRTREEQAARERLAAEKRFNQLFSEVRGFFSPDDAEVYRQGTDLVIRLRAIQFPVGKHVIMPSNYTLLNKVQRAIRTFGEPDIVIEGHTDTTGFEMRNEHLSQKRAEAVRSYLVANETLSMEKITAVGYGSKRPLASNRTAKGRAINRRIDVIITPHPQRL
jgi:outer membrane protein OmpA-like peptidoglycan-associated protein